MTIGILTGLDVEARTLPSSLVGGDAMVELSAANPARAERGARRLVEQGARALISYGLAAGLNPRFGPGTVVIPNRVLAYQGMFAVEDKRSIRDHLNRLGSFRREADAYPESYYDDGDVTDLLLPDTAMRHAFMAAFEKKTIEASLVGVARPIVTRDEKIGLLMRTEAFAADMESHIVGAVAREAGLPFLVLRVVGDPSNRNIPRSAMAGFDDDGKVASGRVLAALATRPWEIGDLLSLALDTRAALRSLRRVGRGLPPLLA